MKKLVLTAAVVLGAIFVLNTVHAEMMGPGAGMGQNYGRGQQSKSRSQQDYSDRMEMMYRYMMGGRGFGPGIMPGYGMGPGIMGGYGMGPGMMPGFGMRHGYGMGYGMMGMGGHGYCQGPDTMWNYRDEEFNKFLDETKETRRKLHDLRFEYGEMVRKPTTTIEDLRRMEKEMYELQEKLEHKFMGSENED